MNTPTVRAALAELVALKALKDRLHWLHEMGHGTDYGDYYKRKSLAWDAARAALAAEPAAPVQPLTEEQIMQFARETTGFNGSHAITNFVRLVRLVERAHNTGDRMTDTTHKEQVEAANAQAARALEMFIAAGFIAPEKLEQARALAAYYGASAPAASEPVALKKIDEMILRELSAIQKIALAGGGGEIEADPGFNEIAQRLGYLARSIPDLSRLVPAPAASEPTAWVPVHPANGPLWAMTTDSPSPERLPSYPLLPLYTAPQPPAASSDVQDARRLSAFTEHPNWELSMTSDPDEEEDRLWQVHRCSGGRNDREWTLVGHGPTPRAAIDAALKGDTTK